MSAILTLLAPAVLSSQNQISDAEMLELGHEKWIAQFQESGNATADDFNGAERRFSLALASANARKIEAMPDRKEIATVQMWIGNIVKNSCRLGDAALFRKENHSLYNSKAATLANLTVQRFIDNSVPQTAVTQADLWKEFAETRNFHIDNKSGIEKFDREFGGYDYTHHIECYDSLAYYMSESFKAIANRPVNQKQTMFHLCMQMVKITRGEDPLPYPG